MPISTQDFDYIRDIVRKRSAIVLEPGKEYLVESRLTVLARQEGLSDLQRLVDLLRSEPLGNLQAKVVEAMTTNETTFFRDVHPFTAMQKKLLPSVVEKRQKDRRIDILCLACSTGQEPYSLAMLVKEHFPQLAEWNVRITACDLSTEVLGRAKEGRYTQLEVNRGLPAPLLVKHFEKEGADWRLKESIRKMVQFQTINLIERWPIFPPMDFVFLRNVLIYFDRETKQEILEKVKKVLTPHGYLFLGTAETTMGIDESFARVEAEGTRCYQRGAA